MKFPSALVLLACVLASSTAIEIPIVSNLLLSILGPSSATAAATSVALNSNQNQDIVKIFSSFINDVGPRFQCGFGQNRVPVLDPLFMSNYSSVFNQIGNLTNVNMAVTNVTTTGLSKYQVTNLKFTIDDRKLVLGLTYPQLVMNGLHATNATLNGQQLTGKGTYTVTITNLHVEAETVFAPFPKFNVSSIVFTALSVDSVSANFVTFGNSNIDSTVNQNFNAGGPVWVSKNLKFINSAISTFLLKFSNERLQNFGSFANVLLAMINYVPGKPCSYP